MADHRTCLTPRFTGVIQLIDYILSLAKFTANQQRNADNIVRLATDGSRYWNGLSKCSGHKWDGTASVICPYQSVTSVLAAWHVSTESSFLSTTASSATDNNTSHALMMRFTNITENYTHTHPSNGPFSGTTQVSQYQKGKTNLKQQTVRGSGISRAIRKSAPCSRQITMPTPHHSVFYRPDVLPAAQPTASKQWRLNQ